MESENRHEFDVTLGTFEHPRYEIVPTGDVYDGADEVAGYFKETRTAFPDQRNELIALFRCTQFLLPRDDPRTARQREQRQHLDAARKEH